MNRAWATLNIKSFDEGKRTFEGIASTPSTDRMGDIVEPKGAMFKLPLPYLYQHDSKKPVGQITSATVKADGIHVKGYVENLEGPPTLKERLDVAWAEMKAGLVRGLSIGFNPIDAEPIKGTYGLRFKSWEWLELSLVTIAANQEASITTIKAMDEQQRAALGQSLPTPVAVVKSPGATGKVNLVSPTEKQKMNIKEQITSFENKRAATQAALDELMSKAAAEGATLSDDESTKYDELAADIKSIDRHLDRLRDHEKVSASKATEVQPNAGMESSEQKSRVRVGDGVLKTNANLPKGMALARYVKALAFAKGNNAEAQAYARQWDESTPEVTQALKSAVAAGTATDSAWAGPLVYNQNMASEFLAYLRPQTIIGKLSGFRNVPFNIRYATQSAGSTVGWVGEGAGKPVSKLTLSSASLGFAKAAGIVVITQELARYSSPAAEMLVRDDLAAAMVAFLDQQFIDPGVAAVASTSPASVTNGSSNVRQAAAAWTSTSNIETDVKAFLQTFADNEIYLDSSSYWVMTPSTALALSMIRTTNGPLAYEDININGGSFFGIPVVTSNSVPHSVSAGSIVALVKCSEIQMADDGQLAIDVSQEASLQMDGAPTQNSTGTPTATSVVSMFQTNSLAVRVERVINWARRRGYAVGYIDNMHTS